MSDQAGAPGVEIPWKEGSESADKAHSDIADGKSIAESSGKGDKDVVTEQKAEPAVVGGDASSSHLAPPSLEVEEFGSTDGSDIEPSAGDDLANQLNKLNAFVKEMAKSDDAEEHSSPSRKTVDDDAESKDSTNGLNTSKIDKAEQYHNDAQQAFVLAANGGLNAVLIARRDAEYAESGIPILKSADEEHSASIVAPEVGRSLFFALDLTTWEQDENVVLEVGWAATWFQEVLMVDDQDQKVSLEPKEGETEDKDGGALEQITEYGHIMSVANSRNVISEISADVSVFRTTCSTSAMANKSQTTANHSALAPASRLPKRTSCRTSRQSFLMPLQGQVVDLFVSQLKIPQRIILHDVS